MARSRLRFWLLILIPILALLVLAANRLREDSARLTLWLQEWVLSTTGLTLQTSAPGDFDFWPELSLSLRDVHLLDGAQPVASASTLAINLPWSALRGDALQLGGIKIGTLQIEGAGAGAWWQRRFSAEQGPAQPWQWPQLSAPLAIESLRFVASSPDSNWQLHGFELDRWQTGQMAKLVTTVQWRADGPELPVLLLATPKQDGHDLQLAPFALAIDPEVANIQIAGTASINHLHHVAFDGDLKTGDLSQRVGFDALDLDRPNDLQLQLRGYFDGALRLRALGNLFAEAIDLDIGLPSDWRAHLEPPMALLDVLQGQIKLARLRLGASEWVRLNIEGLPLQESPATALPARAAEPPAPADNSPPAS